MIELYHPYEQFLSAEIAGLALMMFLVPLLVWLALIWFFGFYHCSHFQLVVFQFPRNFLDSFIVGHSCSSAQLQGVPNIAKYSLSLCNNTQKHNFFPVQSAKTAHKNTFFTKDDFAGLINISNICNVVQLLPPESSSELYTHTHTFSHSHFQWFSPYSLPAHTLTD